MAEKAIIGCDIGNAYAYASVVDSVDRDPVALMPEEYKRVGMPTAAFVPANHKEQIQVCDLKTGVPEKLMRKTPAQVVGAVKRCFTQNTIILKETGPQGRTIREIKPEEIYASIVRDLMIMANATRASVQSSPIYDLVFTYPAAFLGDNRVRERMQEAIESVTVDGHQLHVVSSLPEPAAVALDYLYYVRHIQSDAQNNKPAKLTVLVVDLGHGSLDLAVVTAMDQAGERPYVVHSYGSTATPLGGIDFDFALEEHIRELVRNHCDWDKAFNDNQEREIGQEARRIKHMLSNSDSAALELDFIVDAGKTQPPPITRETFEKLTADILAQILERAEDQLLKAQNESIKIDRIILSGGGSNMPMLRKGIEELVEKKYPVEPFRPGEAVSFGAARYAWYLKPVPKRVVKKDDFENTDDNSSIIRQRAQYSYGLRYEDPVRKEYRVRYLIPYQSKLPASNKISWSCNRIDLDIDIRRSKTSVKTGDDAALEATTDIVNKTFHGVPKGECNITMKVDDEHHVSVTCQFSDGTIKLHGTGKYRKNEGGND